ncbi:protein of unknown function DUF324 [Pirellula staleyi DSM 6068]|uniref:CRISPR type III-associated protein domain-containing protein n=1 Tax=Pirellula staleyi (strain ATCC 27377 / DSM 6068 / ICPB 4128) TaxID=530564 RepID=D2R8Z7_PIRSD|nr:TIGR03986 family CRISPR-associated RAMP protein [Pirellula staleyi]ADB15824.1 protein of unknown function DUF324 [Pirellula staleyi DSM 6068]
MTTQIATRYQLKSRWKITGTLTTTSPMHIGSGDSTTHPQLVNEASETDSTIAHKSIEVAAIVRDFQGKPIIPGSALKGVLRSWAEKRYTNYRPQISKIFGDLDCSTPQARSGRAVFRNAILIPPKDDLITRYKNFVPYWRTDKLAGILSHVCIDRHNGTASANKLFFEEFLPEGISFKVEIFAEQLDESDVQLLLSVLVHGVSDDSEPIQFGSNTANGWGQVSWSDVFVSRNIDNSHVELDLNTLSFRQRCNNLTIDALPAPPPPDHIKTIPLLFQCRGPFLVNDGSRVKRKEMSEAEKERHRNFTPLRRADGSVWLPASSFRGVLRSRAEFILRSLDPSATGDPNKPLSKDNPIEKIFGMTGHASRLQIDEFSSSTTDPKLRHQDFVAIDRFTGGAADTAKFDAEYADHPTFSSRLRLNTHGLSESDIAILAATLRDLTRGDLQFGFGVAKGYGELVGNWTTDAEAWARKQLQHLPVAKRSEIPNSSGPSPSPTKANVIEGKLIFQKIRGEDKPVRRLVYRNKKNEWTTQAPTPIVFASLPQSLQTNTSPEIEVDFEWASPNKPTRVRERGTHLRIAARHNFAANQANDYFAHAYYFLRHEERRNLGGNGKPSAWPNDLADRNPYGHERYQEGCYSGTISVRLTTKTPLLLCDDLTRRETQPGHYEYDMRGDDEGNPILHSSSVRGMLRSAYEAITNSRMGVFTGHDDRLGLRMQTQEGLALVPCRIESGKVVLLPGTSQITVSRPSGPMYAAWLPAYPETGALRLSNTGNLPQHRQHVSCWIELWERTPWVEVRNDINHGRFAEDKKFSYWKVVAIAPHGQHLSKPSSSSECPRIDGTNHHTPKGEPIRFIENGYVCSTNYNFDKKHDERVFFVDNSSELTPIPLSESLVQQWGNLIRNYRLNEDLAKDKKRPGALTKAGWSRHMKDDRELTLADGSLAYARLDAKGSVIELFPVMIARKLYPRSPWCSTPRSLLPATSRSMLSPADRLFGWVNQECVDKDSPAYRSQLRVGVVECKTNEAIRSFNVPMVVPILSQPKPSQGRFYLGDKTGRTQPPGGSKEDRGYSGTNRIRGPKVYPHHAAFSLDRVGKSAGQAGNQNRSITGCVREGVEFKFNLHVLNLSRLEVSALFWLLTLPPSHYLRLGLGKPLGFGSVSCEIVNTETRISDGSDWIASLKEWDALPPGIDATAIQSMAAEYESQIGEVNPTLMQSFLQIAKGFGCVETGYPPSPDSRTLGGEHFKWFAANERNRAGARSLPDPSDNDPLLPKML